MLFQLLTLWRFWLICSYYYSNDQNVLDMCKNYPIICSDHNNNNISIEKNVMFKEEGNKERISKIYKGWWTQTWHLAGLIGLELQLQCLTTEEHEDSLSLSHSVISLLCMTLYFSTYHHWLYSWIKHERTLKQCAHHYTFDNPIETVDFLSDALSTFDGETCTLESLAKRTCETKWHRWSYIL